MKKGKMVMIPTPKGVLLEKVSNIICIEAEGSYCELTLLDGSQHMISKNLAGLCKMLPQDEFFRIHASVAIGMAHIRQIIGNDVLLEHGRKFPIAQRRKKQFLDKLKEKALSF